MHKVEIALLLYIAAILTAIFYYGIYAPFYAQSGSSPAANEARSMFDFVKN